ncbi:MAG: hypothetical protein M9939_25670 [Mesorhizobium sp.]|nr:hypothetical protein [Mesorhizobium sp.]MCO5164483.1 hypothetical protein [Mesorhizobium sp.]
MRTRLVLLFGAALTLAGCVGDGVGRQEGVTSGAGNAIAANTVMQIVDPWQPGVEDTDLRVPATRASASASAAPEKPAAKDGSDN